MASGLLADSLLFFGPNSLNMQNVTRTDLGFEAHDFQVGAVAALLSGKDCVIIRATGGGKTWVFCLLAKVHNLLKGTNTTFGVSKECSVVYIVCPLIAVMKQQMDVLNTQNIGLRGAALGSLDCVHSDNEATIGLIASSQVHVVWLPPEYLVAMTKDSKDHRKRLELFKKTAIAWIFDEVHLFMDAGDVWRDAYQVLEEVRPLFPNTPIGVASASIPRTDFCKMLRRLRIREDAVHLVGNVDRPNIFISVRNRTTMSHDLGFIKTAFDTKVFDPQIFPVLLYNDDKKVLGSIIDFIIGPNKPCPPNLLKFTASSSDTHKAGVILILATRPDLVQLFGGTGAFGNGLNPSNIVTVIHYRPPKSFCNYFQEIGRAGRNGAKAKAILFMKDADFELKKKDSKAIGVAMIKNKEIYLDFIYGKVVCGIRVPTCRRKGFEAVFEGGWPVETLAHCCDICDLSNGVDSGDDNHVEIGIDGRNGSVDDCIAVNAVNSEVVMVHNRSACRMTAAEQAELCNSLQAIRVILLAECSFEYGMIIFPPFLINSICADAKAVAEKTFQWPVAFHPDWVDKLSVCVVEHLNKYSKNTNNPKARLSASSAVIRRHESPSVKDLRNFAAVNGGDIQLGKVALKQWIKLTKKDEALAAFLLQN
ncbi:P-loop containing nucleoside triphosphate hydrolase protein [Obelidium mucronatum]|nr:P-loop containing nucleoside triphosphate hydrolase protein [Obelidium mucronatum]KAI9350895.1 P-loop containing nucleoside triphosphate hydrolase protein [Obelidium mucronatum]